MHGDFLAEVQGEKGSLIGGLALLSGYISKVRAEEENVLYVISGDMLQGSLIDSEYKGISTIEIMNYLAPDVVALGNHEFDYGLPHLLFLEKMGNFPIVNANLYIKKNNKRLMRPYVIIELAGFHILLTGIITDKVIDSITAQDDLIGSFISLNDAAEEVGRITNAYKKDDIDLTILLTHIGLESDKQLAQILKPEWGVDMILGGHSHSILEIPENINNILIAQAGVGTDQIGRFDIFVDDETNSIVDFQWQLIPITTEIAQPDQGMIDYIESFKTVVDRKYNALLCKFSEKLTHPVRFQETSLGNLVADALTTSAECDVMFVGSGGIRLKELGPVVTLKDFISCFPYDNSLTRLSVTGKTLKKIFTHIMRPENRTGEGENYQVNSAVQAIYNDAKKRLETLSVRGTPVIDNKHYKICLESFHLRNSDSYLNTTEKELYKFGDSKVISTSARGVLEEYFRNHQNLGRKVEGRLVFN